MLQNFMPNYFKSKMTEGEDNDRQGPRGVKSKGPQRFRTISAGQQRRAQARFVATRERKENLRFRKRWMANQLATAVLRGQLQVVGALPWADGSIESKDPNGVLAAHLTRVYGSPQNALSRYLDIVTEAARAQKVSA